ncbi:hypothetical protein PAL_GLEAN10015271 [Pteropus alecto]|uniref:Uncharacterized protein n=1 Tax=Pteropus alecto TaxID=9402 RepID=L5KED5_PTEAL|nr:hypothetical protein PAL_GLEAN10015271 [Pteropus alecto]
MGPLRVTGEPVVDLDPKELLFRRRVKHVDTIRDVHVTCSQRSKGGKKFETASGEPHRVSDTELGFENNKSCAVRLASRRCFFRNQSGQRKWAVRILVIILQSFSDAGD